MWVFAAKLHARKRPYLAPVRDTSCASLLTAITTEAVPG